MQTTKFCRLKKQVEKKTKNQQKQKSGTTKRKLQDMQRPTSEAIGDQVSNEVAELLPDQISGYVVEVAVKTSSKRIKQIWQALSPLNKALKNQMKLCTIHIWSLWTRFLPR